ncbi:protein EVI2A [Latimeria chalumnae]|uniref:Ecotropic viral integration site 2A n=1 Tax=Latimeria chalumnae TaxID=7897 RepID=H3BC07_LATCH|nr:PREDICTED: protein EVI2A [Latimeria chalumnae]XP_005987525.1 PREDICTED: protein EVI2A [Latimeria chalumnae]XP_005987526.1 PREDICTED: protein EVI2A [Latimeria chalumnae]XP_005987527.1 PREDICTED: protein EVI2A [Latimeria chalumnae]XP_005987529.1 PREDICTED: protein EVI2A [Latimeria chalumnae]XP_014346875.1 PREDICTED: protein EVI2A [Latimeria chalumnae]|eukprot:XP_005987524.1 PREDICTED: protein EVI2A [Latimeria chalumnae]
MVGQKLLIHLAFSLFIGVLCSRFAETQLHNFQTADTTEWNSAATNANTLENYMQNISTDIPLSSTKTSSSASTNDLSTDNEATLAPSKGLLLTDLPTAAELNTPQDPSTPATTLDELESKITDRPSIASNNRCNNKSTKFEAKNFLITIGVLIILCTILLISTVALANQVSYLKKASQKVHHSRSNADFLTSSSLWPGSGAWQTRSNVFADSAMIEMAKPEDNTESALEKKEQAEILEDTAKPKDNQKKNKDTDAPLAEDDQTTSLTNFILEV